MTVDVESFSAHNYDIDYTHAGAGGWVWVLGEEVPHHKCMTSALGVGGA